MPNSSPVTTIMPIIRIPQNCATTITLLGHDPDGDLVSCRHGYYYGECSFCSRDFQIDHNKCTISIPSRINTGSYVVELILEDFPKNNIYLTYNDGTRVFKYRPLNRKSRELPEDYQKYYWYDTTLSETVNEDTLFITELVTELEPATDFTAETTTAAESSTFTEPSSDSETAHHYYTSQESTVESANIQEYITSEALEELQPTSHYEDVTALVTPSEPTETQTPQVLTTLHYSTMDKETLPEAQTTLDYYTTDTETPGIQYTLQYDTTESDVTYPDDATTLAVTDPFTAMRETTQHILTEAVTFPYETTEWDFYPTSDSYIYMDSLSRISLQFLVEVTSAAPSCTLGNYRPKFISPTPHQGEKLLTNVGSVFQLHLSAQAAYTSVSDFKVSGPPGMTKSFTSKSRSTTKSMVVEWTPSKNNVGDHVPVCFIAETSNGYQSEMRCVIVVVGPSSLDNIELICHENTMTLIAAKSSDHELYENQFRLNDPKCLVSFNSTHLIASVAYNTCGTETEETEHDIVFKNQATSFSNRFSVITRKHGVSIPFNCSFPKKNRVSASFLAHKSDYVFAEAGFGNFTYKFQFYTDDRFAEVETQYPLEVTLKELLYMEIQVSSSVPNVQLFVESCKATPHDNPNDPTFYDIIQNGCISDETLVVFSSTRTQYRFGMEAFAFMGNYDEVYLSCTVILCKFGAPGTRCIKQCIPKSLGDSNRHRRSVDSESQQHFISQGPLKMKRQSPSNAGEASSLNVNALVISLLGVVIIVLVGSIFHIHVRRGRLPGYELLKTQDF
ncbi:uncharacterized protein LOC130276750 [Hyla sarda]|uniref:uncharacterized protein LOC130276750 n=1 Tax=Hyla sarda TaxID=327740 RepID=UPI0024C3F6C8|nr:uncharacterized protein LOC130276750 [Hyla sarda]